MAPSATSPRKSSSGLPAKWQQQPSNRCLVTLRSSTLYATHCSFEHSGCVRWKGLEMVLLNINVARPNTLRHICTWLGHHPDAAIWCSRCLNSSECQPEKMYELAILWVEQREVITSCSVSIRQTDNNASVWCPFGMLSALSINFVKKIPSCIADWRLSSIGTIPSAAEELSSFCQQRKTCAISRPVSAESKDSHDAQSVRTLGCIRRTCEP